VSTQKQHKKSKEKKTEVLHCRIEPELKKLAESQAKLDRRNLTSWIEVAILEKAERDTKERDKG